MNVRTGVWTVLLLMLWCAAAEGQYRPAPRRDPPASEEDSFEAAVDLKRHRQGYGEWDTQELIAAGLTALHEEHERILRELEAIKSELKQLKGQRE